MPMARDLVQLWMQLCFHTRTFQLMEVPLSVFTAWLSLQALMQRHLDFHIGLGLCACAKTSRCTVKHASVATLSSFTCVT